METTTSGPTIDLVNIDQKFIDTLNNDQLAAFRVMAQGVSDFGYGRTKPIVITGYAGTGKTYLAGCFLGYLKSISYKIMGSAPTHKAAGVFEEKLSPFGDFEVRTIYSICKMQVAEDLENGSGGHVIIKGQPDIPSNTVVVLDEASMGNDDIADVIESRPDIIWILLGDLAQLPPVGQAKSRLLNEPDYNLTTPVRQKEGSSILDLATAVRQGDISLDQVGEDVEKVREADELFSKALEAFRNAEYQKDAAFARMLVFRNKRRKALNKAMRALIVDSDQQYCAGEWLVMYQRYSITDGEMAELKARAYEAGKGTRIWSQCWKSFFELKDSVPELLHVSQEVRVVSAQQVNHKADDQSWKAWALDVETMDGQVVTLYVLNHDEGARYMARRAEMASEARKLTQKRNEFEKYSYEWNQADKIQGRAWGRFFDLEKAFAWVDYAYAMTVHKSQGSTFTHAFVDADDIRSSGGMRQSLLYTAATRPSESLTILSSS